MKLRYIFIPLGVLATIAALIACIPTILILFFIYPTDDKDNADPNKRPEMIQTTITGGRLSPFPKTATNFEIHTEGNMFTRTFRGSFTDTPENIQEWLNSSPGVKEGKKEEDRIIWETGEADYGEIVIFPDGKTVTFRVSWS